MADLYNEDDPALLEQTFFPRTRKLSNSVSLSQKNSDDAFKRFMELSSGADDYSQAQLQAIERSRQANMDDSLAIAAQYAGPKFANMQNSYLKRAMAGREPTRVGNVMIGPDGTVVRDAAADRMKQAELQLRFSEKYAQDADRDETRQNAAMGSIKHILDPNTGEITFYNDKSGKIVASPLSKKSPPQGDLDPKPGFNFPNGPPKLVDTQDKSRYFAQMMTAALPDMIEPLKKGYTPTRIDQVAVGPTASGYVGKMANALTTRGSASELGRQFYTAGRQILAAILRKESGAAITDDEWANYGPMYLPWPGESKEDHNRKMNFISDMVDNVAMGSGPAYRFYTSPKRYDGVAINDQAPKGVPQATWDGMSQAQKDEYSAAGENP